MDHGTKRDSRKPPTEAEKAKEAQKIREYNEATDELFRRKAARDWSQAALDLTSRVLGLNPEFTTAWNYRRRILLDGILSQKTGQERQAILNDDLHLTSLSLRKNPKNYSVWEHRKWLLRNMPDPDWGFELAMVEKQLDKDPRNFHGWNYRRHVVNSLAAAGPAPEWSTIQRPRITVQSELSYTHTKISSNFSNFSAWHYRSKLLGRMTAEQWAAIYSKELDLVRNALWTDPDDQSGWLYHSWLIGDGTDKSVLEKEIASIEELLQLEPDSKWCLETLVRYQSLLLRRHGQEASVDTAALRTQCSEACERLRKLDPSRRERYKWLQDSIV